MEKNLFEIATRKKYRFFYKGLISVEDLWDLPLTDLDSIFKTLNAEVKRSNEESLLQTKGKEAIDLDQQIEIVKHIVSVKLAEQEARKSAAEKRERKQQILEIMAAKQNEELHSKSVDDLRKMLDELD